MCNIDKCKSQERKTMSHRILISRLVFAVLLFVSTSVIAQSPDPSAPQAPLGSGFTYQGQLKQNGAPVNATCDMAFRLYDAATSGAQVGSPITTTVPVTNGLFTVALDFGVSAFTGEARWLDVQVRCPMNAGNFAALTPRQALTAAPYALSLMPNATIDGLNNTGNLSFGNVTRQMLNLWGTEYGIGVQSYTVYNRTDYGGGFAWYEGGTHSNTQNDPGPFGTTQMRLNSSEGLRVNGKISASANVVSPGAVVSGTNTVSGYGVYGASASGGGVIGKSGMGDGVTGVSDSATGIHGVSTSGNGVIGDSDTGNGVVGNSHGSSTSGLLGNGFSNGWGVSGSGGLGGVYGSTSNSSGGGVYGYNGTATYVNSGAGVVGYGFNTNGVAAISINANPIVALGSDLNDREFIVANNGNVFADGTFSSPAADFAELLPAANGLEAGDVLVIDRSGKLARSTHPYQLTVVGVYSTQPAFLGGRGDDTDAAGKVPLAIIGVVPVKVSAENGAIQPGDLLVAASIAGHAMRADQNPPGGTVIGKALGSFKGDTGVIQMLVMLQ